MMPGEKRVGMLLATMLGLAERAYALLLTDDPDPNQLRAVFAERQDLFLVMQKQVAENGVDDTVHPQMVRRLSELDEQCIRLANAHKERLAGLLSDAQQYKPVLRAYDPTSGPGQTRGWYVDRKDT